MLTKLKESVNYIKKRTDGFKPLVGIVLGTGLGDSLNITVKFSIPYTDVPHMLPSTTAGHKGCFLFGRIENVNVVCMQGRLHFYEGYDLKDITYPIRIMGLLGIKFLIVTNASGGLNPSFSARDIMVITDHINFCGENPLRGENIEELGERFPDMCEPYDKKLYLKALEKGAEQGIILKQGVYVWVCGPSMETPAETRMLRQIGGDAVGMSTVPEVIVARHMNIRVLGLSVISNVNKPDCMQPAPIEMVIENAHLASPKLALVIKGILKEVSDGSID
ncbi:MAG: purine-nucleoside phosphorylase [Deltaproteobacteria bacterium]|nr:purine-nucleoside phosphorylase [Deltaproteobacteria bacterium]